MTITAGMVKDLREKTGVGMMECKKALEENKGDMEKAVLWLRERGLSRAAAKAGRVAAEGVVEVLVNEDHNAGVLLELNCETDFVSKNDDFRAFAKEAAALALKNSCHTVDTLSTLQLRNGSTVKNYLPSLIAKIGENIQLRRVQVFKSVNGTVNGYTHMGGTIGTVVVVDGAKGSDLTELTKDLAMHVAAAAPRYLTPADVNPVELAQERELASKKLAEEKKPANILEKILEGQIKKFYKEVCLIEQAYVKDPNVSVEQLLKNSGKPISLSAFGRFQLGEGIEKKQEDFAAEVAAQLKK